MKEMFIIRYMEGEKVIAEELKQGEGDTFEEMVQDVKNQLKQVPHLKPADESMMRITSVLSEYASAPDTKIEDEEILECIEIGLYADLAVKSQPYRFAQGN